MSLARSLRRSSQLWRMRRAQWALVCAAWVFVGLTLALRFDLRIAVPLAVVVALLWPLDRARVARALDDANRMQGRVIAAFELAQQKARTPFMEAALRDADAQRLASTGAPRAAPWWLLLSSVAPLWYLVILQPSTEPQPNKVATPAAREEPAMAELTVAEPTQPRSVKALATQARVLSAQKLRALADALVREQVTPAARAQLQADLERAREHERNRLAEARRDAEQRQQERKLDQLARPPEEQRKLDQLTRPPEEQRKLDALSRPREDSATPPRQEEGSPEERSARADEARPDDPLHDPAPSPEQPQLEQQLARAAAALQQHRDREAAGAMRDAAEQLEGEQRQRQRQQFEQAARGGGSEPDTGEHEQAERRIGGSYQDERLRGVHGEGPSRSQVIEGASQRGFASAPYRRVYADYRAHAEQLLERDDVPASERSYVRRYFDLVQPR